MKICVCCCTWLRPKQLGNLLRCYERQDYADRYMVILDDAGQYGNQEGDRWRLVSTDKRYGSLGEKRNAVAAMAPEDTEAFAIWDDDDLYLPHALSASVAALRVSEWSRPSLVLHPTNIGEAWQFRQYVTGGLYHGSWAYRRAMFERLGGYAAGYSGPEDQEFMRRMEAAGVVFTCPIALGFRPFYIYPWGGMTCTPHISGMLDGQDQGQRAWARMGMFEVNRATVVPTDPPWFDIDRPVIDSSVYPRPFGWTYG